MTETVSRPEEILEQLHELWLSLGSHAEREQTGGVLRACALTLIVASEDSDGKDPPGETIAALIDEHPCRAILVRVRDSDQPLVKARVSAYCWLPRGQRRQICSEWIEVSSSRASLPHLAGLILPLAAPDLPVVLWCRSAGLFRFPPLRPVLGLADKLIVDSAGLGEAREFLRELVAESSRRMVADLAWARLTRWREEIARMFRERGYGSRRREIAAIRVTCDAEPVRASHYYLAAWVASALGWDETQGRLRFEVVTGLNGSGHAGVVLAGGELTIPAQGPGLREPSEAEVLGEELSIPGRDPVYERVLPLAERIARD